MHLSDPGRRRHSVQASLACDAVERLQHIMYAGHCCRCGVAGCRHASPWLVLTRHVARRATATGYAN